MGFDADAFVTDGRCVRTDPELSAAFTAAFEWVSDLTGSVDGYLRFGSLDCGHAIEYLSLGLGRACGPDEGIFAPDEVRAMAAAARWPDPASLRPEDLWAYWSARRFVDVCVEQGLGIWFS